MKEHSISQSLFVSRSHADFLDMLSDEEFWNYAADMARYFPIASERFDQYLICDLGIGYGVLPLTVLAEVLPAPAHCALLPSMPIWMQGLIVWREAVIAVVDLMAYFSGTLTHFQRSGVMLLIAHCEDITLGLLAPVLEAVTDLETVRLCSIEYSRYNAPCKGAIKGLLEGAEEMVGVEDGQELLLLDIPVILADIVQHIRINMSYDG